MVTHTHTHTHIRHSAITDFYFKPFLRKRFAEAKASFHLYCRMDRIYKYFIIGRAHQLKLQQMGTHSAINY